MSDHIDVVFSGPPGAESGRFVEVEDSSGAGIRIGEWVLREDGYWVLRIPYPEDMVPARHQPGGVTEEVDDAGPEG